MKKCDFCEHSKLQNGRLICPYHICLLDQDDIYEILDKLGRINIQEDGQNGK